MNKDQLEREVIGDVMLDFSLVDKFLAVFKEHDFSDKRHRYCYKLFQKLANENAQDFSIADVSTTYPKAIELCGGLDYLTDIISEVITPGQFDNYANALIKASTIETIRYLADHTVPIFNEDFDRGLAYVEKVLNNIIDRVHANDSVDLYKEFVSSMKNADATNVDFGYQSLHNIMGYPHPGELLVIGARPGMGKTAFALACLFNYICSEKKRAVMFSLEMSGSELFSRMIASVSGIPLQQVRSARLTPSMKKCLDDNAKELSNNKFLSLYDKTVSNIPGLRAAIRKESKKGEVGLVIVDYLQLITGTGNNNYEKVSEISRQLKLIAREFNCCVIALSQLSRKVEERADKRPQLSDLRESGAIEQDADYVLFLYRHNYYQKDPNVDPTKDPINIEIAKNRHGRVGTLQLLFNLTTGSFKEVEKSAE